MTIFDSGISTQNYVSYVSTDNRQGGRRRGASEWARNSAAKAKSPSSASRKARSRPTSARKASATRSQKEFPGITLVPIIFYGEANAAKSLAVAEDVLTSHSDLTGLFASNESSTVGAVHAIRQRNLAGKVTLVGFDATSDLVQNVREGAIDSLVLQNPFKMGYEGVKTIVDKIGGKQPERRIDTGVELLTKENVDTAEMQELIK